MVKTIFVKKIYSDEFMNDKKGCNFDLSHYSRVIKRGDIDCYWEDEDGKRNVLFKVRRRVISKGNAKTTFDSFVKHSKTVNDQRSIASGTDKRIWDKGISRSTEKIRSNISGYFDKPYMQIQKHFNTKTVCRTTSFTKKNWNKWESSIPFFETIANCYKELCPIEYNSQMMLFKDSPSGFQIGNTPFTTVTSNYNWRTSCHKDKGDYSGGMGNLTILGGDFKGGFIGFPQFDIAVDLRPRDTAIMDVHQWHCNTELDADDNRIRLSFVTYFREKMVDCNKKKVINGDIYYFKG